MVGEAPGREEVTLRQPFVGAAGQLLRGSLASAGFNTDEVFFTNLSKFRPPNNELRSYFDDQGFPNQTLVSGLTDLKAEIELVNPDLIIPVGNYPLKYLCGVGTWTKEGHTGIGNYRGYLQRGTAFAGGRWCLPTYHPSAALRDYSLKHIITTDLRKARTLLQLPEIQYPRRHVLIDPRGVDRDLWASWLCSPEGTLSPCIEGINTPGEDYERTSDRVASSAFLTADIEYIGDKLLCIGFTRHANVSVVFSTSNAEAIGFIRDILLSGIPLCFQNGMFDCSILEWHYGIPVISKLAHDTMIGMHAAYVELPKDLGFIGSIFCNVHPWHQHINKKFWDEIKAGKRSITEILPYNGIDVQVTHEAMEKMLADELTDANFLATYQFEMNMVNELWKIGSIGVPIDKEALAKLHAQLQLESDAFDYGITKYNNDVPVNVKSGPQVAKFIYTAMGVSSVNVPRTPGGQYKMDDSTLATLQLRVKDERQRTAIRMVREARERRDLISKFCEIELDDDGRMRCHYDPAKTVTGRLSSRKFYPTGRGTNLQNVPKDARIRALFVPDHGQLFGYADLKSAESFVVAHITGDAEMLRLHSPEYLSGKLDGHKFVASFLLDKPIELITKDERYLGKRVRHAGNYGMSWAKLQTIVNADAQKTGVSIDAAQAKRLIFKYRQLHPMLPTWWTRVHAQLITTHTIETQHGRKRVFYDRPDSCLPEAIAYNPQGTIADTLNMGLLQVMASKELRELDFTVFLQVHDAIGFQVPERNADQALPLLPDLLNIPVRITRPGVEPYFINIPVDIQVGYNWGEADEDKIKDGKVIKAINPSGLKPWKPS